MDPLTAFILHVAVSGLLSARYCEQCDATLWVWSSGSFAFLVVALNPRCSQASSGGGAQALGESQRQVAELRQQLQGRDQEIAALKSDATAFENAVAQYEAQMETQLADIQNLRKEVEAGIAEKEELEKEMVQLEKAKSQAQEAQSAAFQVHTYLQRRSKSHVLPTLYVSCIT